MKNTLLNYRYKDGGGHKAHSDNLVLSGELTKAQIKKILERAGEDSQGFVPSAIGLEDLQGELHALDSNDEDSDELDHPFHEIMELAPTKEEPNQKMSAGEFYKLITETDFVQAGLEADYTKREY